MDHGMENNMAHWKSKKTDGSLMQEYCHFNQGTSLSLKIFQFFFFMGGGWGVGGLFTRKYILVIEKI